MPANPFSALFSSEWLALSEIMFYSNFSPAFLSSSLPIRKSHSSKGIGVRVAVTPVPGTITGMGRAQKIFTDYTTKGLVIVFTKVLSMVCQVSSSSPSRPTLPLPTCSAHVPVQSTTEDTNMSKIRTFLSRGRRRAYTGNFQKWQIRLHIPKEVEPRALRSEQ